MAEIRNLTRNGETFYPLTTSSAVINEATGEGLVIDDEPTAGSNNLVKSGGVYAKKANIDGYYETMGVGTADNLTGQIESTNDVMYRKTGGSEEVASGTATIANIKGNTIAWNHLFDLIDYTRETTRLGINIQGNGVYKISGTSTGAVFLNITNIGVTLIGGHKYYFGGMRGGSESSYRLWIESSSAFPPNSRLFVGEKPMIRTASDTEFLQDYKFYFQVLRAGITVDTTISPTLFDLTLIYGAGNEPTTPEQFEADYFKWFGKPLGYEPYDAGSLRPVLMNGIKTIGFNQWDEEWELGNINGNTGANQDSYNRIRSKNYIKVICGANYYFRGPINTNIRIVYYDESKNVISAIDSNDSEFTTPNNAFYIRFVYGSGAAPYTSYNHDICINISNPAKDGTYEPYEEHLASVPVTSAKGRMLDSNGNVVGNSVFVFPDGLKKVGNIQDEIFVENGVVKAIKRVGSVDLGTLSWQISATSGMEYRMISNAASYGIKGSLSTSYVPNLLCAKYQTIAPIETENSIGISYYDYSHYIFVGQNSYTDPSAFQTAVSGVMLYYELKNPQVYELDTFYLPIRFRYQVDNNGTEEQIQKSGAQGVAAILTCIYSVDAVKILDKLPQNYISEKSMDNFLAQLNNVTGGGTWTKTWNDNTGEWDFSFTPNA